MLEITMIMIPLGLRMGTLDGFRDTEASSVKGFMQNTEYNVGKTNILHLIV